MSTETVAWPRDYKQPKTTNAITIAKIFSQCGNSEWHCMHCRLSHASLSCLRSRSITRNHITAFRPWPQASSPRVQRKSHRERTTLLARELHMSMTSPMKVWWRGTCLAWQAGQNYSGTQEVQNNIEKAEKGDKKEEEDTSKSYYRLQTHLANEWYYPIDLTFLILNNIDK